MWLCPLASCHQQHKNQVSEACLRSQCGGNTIPFCSAQRQASFDTPSGPSPRPHLVNVAQSHVKGAMGHGCHPRCIRARGGVGKRFSALEKGPSQGDKDYHRRGASDHALTCQNVKGVCPEVIQLLDGSGSKEGDRGRSERDVGVHADTHRVGPPAAPCASLYTLPMSFDLSVSVAGRSVPARTRQSASYPALFLHRRRRRRLPLLQTCSPFLMYAPSFQLPFRISLTQPPSLLAHPNSYPPQVTTAGSRSTLLPATTQSNESRTFLY